MHRSRLASFWVDVPGNLFDATVRFWRDGLGYGGRPSFEFPDTYYMVGTWSCFGLGVERVDDGSIRWHLEVATHDVEETIRHLVASGARVDQHLGEWARLIDPSGIGFCVVPGATSAVSIDIPAASFEVAAAFWAAALGAALIERPGDPRRFTLGTLGNAVTVGIQRLGVGQPRWHVDIESDDVDAEVVRLERLGAERVEQIETWWTMRDPVGQPFCVTQVQTTGFDDAAPWK
jgi:hypothetical protein